MSFVCVCIFSDVIKLIGFAHLQDIKEVPGEGNLRAAAEYISDRALKCQKGLIDRSPVKHAPKNVK